jgi:iron complex transport system substrate-binding protein
MQQEVQSVTAKITAATPRPRVFVELDATDPTKIFTVGPGSFVDAMVAMAGGSNVAHDAKSAYPQLGLEALVAADPQVIILNDAAYGATAAAVAQRPGWASLSAVKEHRIFPIDDALVSRPGPRLADGLVALAKLVHPELFP